MVEKRKYTKSPDAVLTYTAHGLGEQEGKLNLLETIKKNCLNLESEFVWYTRSRDLGVLLKNHKSFAEYLQEVVDKINNNEITGQLVEDERSSYNSQRSEGYEIIPYWLSCVYTVLAQKAESVGDNSKGWSLAAHSCYYAGLSNGVLKNDFFKSEFHKRHKQASKASNAYDRNHSDVKREAARLLKDLAPKGGWKSKASAIEGIEKKICDFIEINGVGLAISGAKGTEPLKKWLSKWIDSDTGINDAFMANMIKNAPRTLCTKNSSD
jgi:hypothetical protein